jgi:hypothetical protein
LKDEATGGKCAPIEIHARDIAIVLSHF